MPKLYGNPLATRRGGAGLADSEPLHDPLRGNWSFLMGLRGPKPGTNVHGDGKSWKSNEFGPAREAFAEWRALPVSQRTPSTQKDLAAELGVAVSTLSAWSRDFGFVQRVAHIQALELSAAPIGAVLATLLEIATDSSHRSCVPAGKALLDWSRDTLENVTEATNYQEMSDAELRETVVGLVDEIDDRMAEDTQATG